MEGEGRGNEILVRPAPDDALPLPVPDRDRLRHQGQKIAAGTERHTLVAALGRIADVRQLGASPTGWTVTLPCKSLRVKCFSSASKAGQSPNSADQPSQFLASARSVSPRHAIASCRKRAQRRWAELQLLGETGGFGDRFQTVDPLADEAAVAAARAWATRAFEQSLFREALFVLGALRAVFSPDQPCSASASAYVARMACQVLIAVPSIRAAATRATVVIARRFLRANFQSGRRLMGGVR